VAAKRGTDRPEAEEAWHHILVAEGSDWFWWFGEHQESDIDHLWDLSFRRQLQEAYRLAGEAPPLELFAPILTGAPYLQHRHPSAPFSPAIDGLLSPPEEWDSAGSYRAAAGGTMQRAGGRLLEELRYGGDMHNLYLLLRPGEDMLAGVEVALYVGTPSSSADAVAPGESPVALHRPREWGRDTAFGGLGFQVLREVVVRTVEHGLVQVTLARVEPGGWSPLPGVSRSAWDKVIEVAIPWSSLDLPTGIGRLELIAGVTRQSQLLELSPPTGALSLDLHSLGISADGPSTP
jgi:hypothetical protein